MGRRKKFRSLLALFKDKVFLIKTALSTDRGASINAVVLRATTRSSLAPPPEHRIENILSLGHGTRPTAARCIIAIMDRLHRTGNACVALKSLFTLHNIIARGSFILKDQLSYYPCNGGANFLNLSKFIDKTDVETRVFSGWVRWYAGFLECNLMCTRVMGCYLSSSSKVELEKEREVLSSLLNSDLLRELRVLAEMVAEISKAPEAVDDQRNELVYEIVRLVGEDYRMTQYHVMIRLNELTHRVDELSLEELDELILFLERMDECKESLYKLFLNKKKNEEFWDLATDVLSKCVGKARTEREKQIVLHKQPSRLVVSTQLWKRVVVPTRLLTLPYNDGGKLLTIDRVPFTVSGATA